VWRANIDWYAWSAVVGCGGWEMIRDCTVVVSLSTGRAGVARGRNVKHAPMKKPGARAGLFVNECQTVRLQDRNRVVDDQTELVDIAFAFVGIGTVPCLTNTERQVFCRASLNDVLGLDVGFVVAAVSAVKA
jgi:hypothetical protein